MKKVKSKFFEYLKSKNLHVTRQREIIIDTFLKEKGHVSVDEFYIKLQEKDSSIGSTTVFRVLKLLVEAHIAEEVDLGDKITRYELKEGRDHHDHLICEECGACIEIFSSKIEKLQFEICKENGFEMTSHRLDIFGYCSKCK